MNLTHDEALIFFEWLSVQDDKNNLEGDEAELRVIWRIQGQLESQLPDIFLPDYAERLAAAKSRI
ncbi:hypothetical protein [Schlesneria sp. T3-172]|uniref:hypothetical protein n=1 Tax=Schlesneria sphaerica TaxID=3373610 RepID=UPI00359FB352